jgi:carboxyl-terminal processing protease
VGYIRLKEFNAKAVNGLEEAFSFMNTRNIRNIVLDLRGNTGGGFQFALNIGGMLMDNAPMVETIGKNNEHVKFKSSYPGGVLYNGDLVLLIDGLSASASEVLTGALHDNCRAVIAGEKSCNCMID